MTTISHVLSASFIAYTLTTNTPPPEMNGTLLFVTLITPAILDLDHSYFIAKDPKFFRENRTSFHKARSFFHELAGIGLVGLIALYISFINVMYAKAFFISFIIHSAEDMIIGKSIPLSPVDKTIISPLILSFKQKTVIDIIVGGASIIAWVLYLNGFHI
jgi:hypothetical protein